MPITKGINFELEAAMAPLSLSLLTKSWIQVVIWITPKLRQVVPYPIFEIS